MNAHPAQHPSAFDLDVYFAQQQPAGASIREHLTQCQSCRNYVETLVEAAAAQFEQPTVPHAQQRHQARRRWAPSFAVGLAMAGALIVVMRTSESPPERQPVNSDSGDSVDDVVAKGTPAVQTIVQSRAGLAVWNGRTSLHAHDVLAFRLACEGYARIAVLARANPQTPAARVYAGECPERPTTLPFSLRVDEQPGSESVTLVLSQRPLSDDALALAANQRTRSQDVWVLTLAFPKAGVP
jgi:hypothetical protein